MNLNLLQRFEEVTIDNTSRISQEDEQFCLKEEESYKVARKALEQAYKSVNTLLLVDSIKEKYIRKYGVVNEIEKAQQECNDAFTEAITQYFSKKYNVEFDYSFIYKSYSFEQFITFEEVLEHLFEQLGGYSFAEMANEQIKNKIKDAVYKFEVKKHTLHLPNYLHIEDDWYGNLRIYYRSEEKLDKLFDALSLFENGEPTKINKFVSIEKEMREGSRKAPIFDKYEMENFNKIKSFKAFKNGKVSIEFHSMEFANEFANTYLKK
ncbi:hypothetical protein C6Y02_17215 [Bacillus sp. NMCC4]|uniref:hypothetical protein n=1 Tax=Bacillus TaxID=1386 RepID=UPI000D02A08A|nr:MULTISPECIES: hypothetical protein [Bacillus]PRS35752.1 hypothetical protein C6Y02_17215 [Bacillus sp. NMCC4]UUD44619.1 hypothetical protein NPA43_18975 [Bacillus pumilus]